MPRRLEAGYAAQFALKAVSPNPVWWMCTVRHGPCILENNSVWQVQVQTRVPGLTDRGQAKKVQSDVADLEARHQLICALKESLGCQLSMFPITAITFGAPRVGNAAFASKFGQSFLAKPEWYQRKSPLELVSHLVN